jgi:hypothetical protein
MTSSTLMSDRTTRALRISGWSLAALLLLAPVFAMQFPGTGVRWTASDFVFAGAVFALVGGLFELAARASRDISYRAAVVAGVACAFLQLWITLAVGIIGNEDNPANWTYIAMVLAALSVAAVTIGEPRALSRAMAVMAVLQLFFFALHMADGHFTGIIDLFFAALWVMSSRLFARAAQQSEVAG